MRNYCNFTGRLTRDVEIRYTNNGKSVASFGIAIDNGKDRDATFIELEAWEKTADNIAKFFSKGKPIEVVARASNDSWEDKNTGETRRKIKFTVVTFEFTLGDGGKGQGGASPSEEPEEEAPPTKPAKKTGSRRTKATKPAASDADEVGDDIPF